MVGKDAKNEDKKSDLKPAIKSNIDLSNLEKSQKSAQGSSCESDSTDTFTTDAGQTGQSGSLARFTILDDYLYTVDDQDLNVFNIIIWKVTTGLD